MADPFNYGGLLGQAQQLVPDVLEREIQRSLGQAQVRQADQQILESQAQTALLNQKAQQGLVATREQQAYSDAVQEALESGDQRRISQLIARFPQFKDALKTTWDQMDQMEQRSNLRQSAGIWSALNAGNTSAAIKQLEGRITADREAGQDTSDDEEQLALLKSGDPKAVNTVKGKLGLFMASVVPEKFASVVDQLGTGNEGTRKGQVVGRAIGHYDENGNWVTDYRDPEPGFTLSEGQTRFEPGASQPSGPLSIQSALPAIVQQESGGNYAAVNRETGALGAYQVMPATAKTLAGRLGIAWNPALMASNSTEGRAYQDRIGQAAIQEAIDASGGDPATMAAYYHGGSDRSKWGPRTQQYAREVVARLGGGQGGAQAVASVPKAPKEGPAQARQMTTQEVQAAGLDPAQSWFMQTNGIPTAIKGGGQGAGGAYSQSALDAFDRAIGTANGLLTHPGLSSAVGVKGLTGGLLGGWVMPGTNAADFVTELDTMKSQVFLPMVQSMKGMGALSNAEGAKLTAAIGNLDARQSEAQFKKSLNGIITDLQTYKARGSGGDAVASGPVKVRSIQEAMALKPGTFYIRPTDRKLMRR